jgi:hypothetical protein
MLATSLSLEAEAQRVATLALSEFIGMRRTDTRPRIAVISRPGALERRIAQAYVSAARAEGDVPVQVEWTTETTPRVAALLAEPSLEAVFLALTARDAAQLRAIHAASQSDIAASRRSDQLLIGCAGVTSRFRFEVPWLLQPGISRDGPPATRDCLARCGGGYTRSDRASGRDRMDEGAALSSTA